MIYRKLSSLRERIYDGGRLLIAKAADWTVYVLLFDLGKLGKNRIIHCANTIVFIEKCPAHYSALVDHKYRRLCNLAIWIVEIISIDDFMIDVRKNWE